MEKYLKARLVDADVFFQKTHDLTYLLELVRPMEPLWVAYEQEMRVLTDYAVEFRYPGASANLEVAKIAQKVCKSFRATARQSLGLKP